MTTPTRRGGGCTFSICWYIPTILSTELLKKKTKTGAAQLKQAGNDRKKKEDDDEAGGFSVDGT